MSFPAVPNLVSRSNDSVIYTNNLCPMIAQVELSHTIDSKEIPVTLLPPASHSISDIDWDAPTTAPMRIRDILTLYLHGMSVQNLIHFQSQEKWIQNLKNTDQVFQVDGIFLDHIN